MSTAKNLSIYGNGVNLACAFRTFGMKANAESLDNTRLCNSSRSYTQGFKDGTISAEGIWDYSETAEKEIHEVLNEAFSNSNTLSLSASIETLAVGGRAIMAEGKTTGFTIDIPLGQLIMTSAEFQADGGIHFGKWIYGATISTSTGGSGVTGASQDNAAASTGGGLFQVHVIFNAATNVTATLQESTNNSVWSDVIDNEFSASGAFSYLLTGTIARYVRLKVVADDSCEVYAALSRR